MGASESTEKLGQRVMIAKGKLTRDLETATQRFEYLKENSAQTLSTMLASVADSFATCSPFLESTLLIVWLFDAEKCKEIVLSACKKVLRAPIKSSEYDWFKNYVFSSNIWMQKSEKSGKFMYEELLAIGNEMSSDIVATMDSIFAHLTLHAKWDKVLAIKTQSLVSRQDHTSVALLREKGLSQVFEMKSDDEQSEDMKNFVDSNMAINMLTSTASKLNDEFQNHIRIVMSAHGNFKEAPMKKVERSLSKVENDYKDESFPKAAKLLDLVRCSVTFNTVEQLVSGYDALMRHMQANSSIIELARVKNGFINTEEHQGGYRDIKVNVIYKSQNPYHQNARMICEVQLLLINYLEEKKKIHKLYSIVREETFFKMAVSEQPEKQGKADGHTNDLKLTQVLNVGKEVSLDYVNNKAYKCSVDPESNLLAMEGRDWFGIVSIQDKRLLHSFERVSRASSTSTTSKQQFYAYHTHDWLTLNGQKYVSVQTNRDEISMYRVTLEKDGNYRFVSDEKYQIKLEDEDATIVYCDYDSKFQHLVLLVNGNVLQKRALSDVHTVAKTIVLEQAVKSVSSRCLRLSADASHCVVAGGAGKNYFYVIDVEHGKQHKMESAHLESIYSSCFINGENECVAVGDRNGNIEIWNVAAKKAIKQLEVTKSAINALASTQNILGVGSTDCKLRLYDIRNWTCFHEQQFECGAWSLHLTPDLKYVTFSGNGADKCVVLRIESSMETEK